MLLNNVKQTYQIMTLRIGEVLKQKGITATRLNELMKEKGTPLSRVSIGTIINGTSNPKVQTLEDMAAAIDVDVRDFFAVPNTKAIYTKDEDGNLTKVGELDQ